jgi:hypothetical protein
MLAAVKVFGSVLVLGGIAATHVSALHAQPQMDPAVPEFDAFLADVRVRGQELKVFRSFMRTSGHIHSSSGSGRGFRGRFQ